MSQTAYTHARMSIMGDSMSTFAGTLPAGYPTFYGLCNQLLTGIYSRRDMWWGQVLSHFEAELLVNNSWSGSLVSCGAEHLLESYGCSEARCGSLHDGDITPDHILVLMGANDRGWGVRPTDPSADSSDQSVFSHAYGTMLDRIRANYPTATVWCLTLPRTVCLRDPHSDRPACLSDEVTGRYNRVIAAVAASRGCRLIDLFCDGVLCDTVEGLHPTFAGMSAIADRVIAVMEGSI